MSESLVTFNIPIEHIHPHPDNPRKDLGDITELTESIRKNGIMQNLSVIPMEGKEDEYMLVIGHRRCAAAKAAGLKEVPCRIINDLEYKEQLAVMLEENMQRNDLTIIEQADCFQMMLDLGEDIETLERKTGFSKQTIKHRVEIAKLDKKILREKAEDDSFQMSIKDLQVLEKIEDINERNRILKESSNSSQLSWKTSSSIKAAEDERKKQKIIAMLEDKGIVKVPNRYQREQYSGKWNTVKFIRISDEIPKRIQLPKSKEPYYYVESYTCINVVQEIKKTKELTDEAKREKEIKAAKKELEAIEKKLDADIREFVIGVADGKYTILKTHESRLVKEIWNIMIRIDYSSVMIDNMVAHLSGKYTYELTHEEKDKYMEKASNLTMLQQMIICMAHNLDKNNEIVGYKSAFKEDAAKIYRDAVSILEVYGFDIDDTARKLIDGTHELWVWG